MKSVRRRNSRPTHRARHWALLGVVAIVAFGQISASAELKLPELPLPTATPLVQDPLNLEDLLNLDQLLNGEDLPVSTDLGDVVDSTTGTVSNLLGGSTEDPPAPGGSGAPPASAPNAPTVDSWSIDGLLPADGSVPTRVSSEKLTSHSYAAAVGQGFARAARRAAELAGPVAAPMVLGLFAVGLLFVAGRGPGRLVKVEEERKAFREQRTFRL